MVNRFSSFPSPCGGNNTSAFNHSILSAQRVVVTTNVPNASIAQLSPLCIAVSLHSQDGVM
jgi:hypothetical protein